MVGYKCLIYLAQLRDSEVRGEEVLIKFREEMQMETVGPSHTLSVSENKLQSPPKQTSLRAGEEE